MSQQAPPPRPPWGQPPGESPSWQSSGQTPPQSQSSQPPPYQQSFRPQAAKTNGLAIAALVCGILWGFGLLAIAAIILGVIARKQIAERGEGGSGLATAGIVLGALGVFGMIVLSLGAASVSNSVKENLDEALSSTTIPDTEATSPPTTASSGPATSFRGEGVYRVGVDIAPGTYRTAGPASGRSCYWERQSAFGGGFDAIIANESLRGPGVVTILPTDKGFKTSGCQRWEMA
jgi:hypothetical protein